MVRPSAIQVRSGQGTIIENGDLAWVKGFARDFGLLSSVMADLWEVRDELLLAEVFSNTHL